MNKIAKRSGIASILTTLMVSCLGTTGCGMINTAPLQVRAPATTYPQVPYATNVASKRDRNLDAAIQRSMEDQNDMEKVEWDFIQHSASHY